MTYDATAKKLAVKVIGTVESNLNYSSINFNDPITVGVAQWFGTRAANILERMRSTNSASWYGVAGSLNNQLATLDPNSTYWNSRYLTSTEGESLRGVLSRNQALQNTQLSEDLDAYVIVFESYNFDADAHTDTLIYFMSMHHQGPAYALEVILTLDTECTLEEMHAACLAHPVFGQYGARYRTTYDLINVADLSGVDPTPPVEPPAPTPTNGNARHISENGDHLLVKFDNGETITYYPNGSGMYLPRSGQLPPPTPAPTQPPPPAGTGDWVHPLPGAEISSPYGPRDFDGFHWGTDLVTISAGASVYAVTDLIITRAKEAGDPTGNGTAGSYVKGHTTDGAYTFTYAHMVQGSLEVTQGQTITAGTKIGVEGATGNVTGRHLHFECYTGIHDDPWAPPYGDPIDPLPVLRAHGVSI